MLEPKSAHRSVAKPLIGPLVVTLLAAAATAWGQASQRTVFVANDGNVEGSVSVYQLNADDSPRLIEKFVIGIGDDAGTNPYTMSLTPSGRYLATGHATASDTVEQITVMEVASDSTLSLVAEFTTPDSPLSLSWINDELLAVTETRIFTDNFVHVYRFDPQGPSLTLIDSEWCGTFCTQIAVHPSGNYFYVGDSGTSNNIAAFEVNPDGTIEPLQTVSTGLVYALGVTIGNDGTKLYGAGGISDGRHSIVGYHVDSGGRMNEMLGLPFSTPGNSPKDFAFAQDDSLLFVLHGTDSTTRSFTIDDESGAIQFAGGYFRIELQGDLGDAQVMNDLLFITDESTAIDGVKGLYSFTIQPDGRFTMNGSIVDSTGSRPESIAVWPGLCRADFNEDGIVNTLDFLAFLNAYNDADPSADFNEDGTINTLDFIAFLNAYNEGCE